MNNEFKSWWKTNFKTISPVPWTLRDDLKNNWFRIHYLPQSKRYPENETEYSIILDRYNNIATKILTNNSECWFVTCRFKIDNEFDFNLVIQEIQHESIFFSMEINLDEDETVLIYSTRVVWETNKYDQYLRCVIDEKCGHSFFVNTKSKRIFVPYDGGADLILENSLARDEVKQEYSDWLSCHQEGL